eukprot:scaffold267609_cov31-Tisochrysis_lutea.AAC.2
MQARLGLPMAHRWRACHGEQVLVVVLELKALVVKRLAVDRVVPCAIAVDDVSALNKHAFPNLERAAGAVSSLAHILWRPIIRVDSPMEGGTSVAEGLACARREAHLPRAQRAEVGAGTRESLSEELECDSTDASATDGDVHPDAWPCVRTAGAKVEPLV